MGIGGGGTTGEIHGDATPYIVASARAHGVDPNVALAVAYGEGGVKSPGPIGDNGTSFGPYQMHQGGALPSTLSGQRAQSWAWSPQGIDYAMARIAKVTQGLEGPAAISAAVRNFERPAQPGPEIARDVAYYNQQAGRGGGGNIGPSGGLGGGSGASSAGAAASQNTGGMLFQCGTGSGGVSLPIVGQVVPNFLPDVGCYLKSTLLFTVYAFGGLGAIVAGVMLVWPRGGKAIKSAGGAAVGWAVAPEAKAAEAVGQRAAAGQIREGRQAELHAERVKQAKARTSETRAKARVQRHRATQERLATGSSTRLSSVEEARIRKAQSRVGNRHPERISG